MAPGTTDAAVRRGNIVVQSFEDCGIGGALGSAKPPWGDASTLYTRKVRASGLRRLYPEVDIGIGGPGYTRPRIGRKGGAMQIGMIGLGRMGGNMVRRLLRGGHECVVFDRNPASVEELAKEGATGAASMEEFVAKLAAPKTAWVMVPAGPITEAVIKDLGERLGEGGVVIDGGNSHFKDDVRRARELRAKGIQYVDAGTSGGVWGLERGYCLMIGGDREVVERLDPIWKTLAPGRGEIPPSPGR